MSKRFTIKIISSVSVALLAAACGASTPPAVEDAESADTPEGEQIDPPDAPGDDMGGDDMGGDDMGGDDMGGDDMGADDAPMVE